MAPTIAPLIVDEETWQAVNEEFVAIRGRAIPRRYRQKKLRAKTDFHLKRFDVDVHYGPDFQNSVRGNLVWDTRSKKIAQLFVSIRLPEATEIRLMRENRGVEMAKAIVYSCKHHNPKILTGLGRSVFDCQLIMVDAANQNSPFIDVEAGLLSLVVNEPELKAA